MADRNTIARTMHDLGLAAWFGGSLMGAVGLNAAVAEVSDPAQRSRVANAGWARWTPVNLAGIAAYMVGGAVLTAENKGRLLFQEGVGKASKAKTALTAVALGATAYSRVLGRRIMSAGGRPRGGRNHPVGDDASGRGEGPAPAEAAAVGDSGPGRGLDRDVGVHGGAAAPDRGGRGDGKAAPPQGRLICP